MSCHELCAARVVRALCACSAAGAPDGTIASGSEDNTVRLWRPDGSCLQVIDHPGCVWDVAFLPDGDLLTACSDYAARLWTSAPDRVADSATVEVRGVTPNCNPAYHILSVASSLPVSGILLH